MRTIGKYEIRGLLGRGGMGKVYKVKHPVIGKIAALKLLEPQETLVQLIGMDRIRKLFLSEAVMLARLRHPNIVQIWDFDETGGKPYYLMNFYFNNLALVIGESKFTENPSRRIAIERAIDYTRQTLRGLDCLHYTGIIHRDIKPYNLLLTEQETVKICDFGLSKVRGETFSGPASLKVGSAWYAAPEQEQNPDQVGVQADIYSVGVILYRMLTGRLPDRPYHSAQKYNPDLDQDWDRFLQTALSDRPDNRYRSARAMQDDLNELEAAWLKKKATLCLLPPDASSEDKTPQPEPISLRSSPIKAPPRIARQTFGLDALWRPANYVRNAWTEQQTGSVLDRTTGLLWQLGGSPFPLSWREATNYIHQLNQDRFAGFDAWRLPTIAELITLLIQTPQGQDHCMEPIFDATQKWLWSCDRSSFIAAWYVSIDMGFVSWRDFKGRLYVRAVGSYQGD